MKKTATEIAEVCKDGLELIDVLKIESMANDSFKCLHEIVIDKYEKKHFKIQAAKTLIYGFFQMKNALPKDGEDEDEDEGLENKIDSILRKIYSQAESLDTRLENRDDRKVRVAEYMTEQGDI